MPGAVDLRELVAQQVELARPRAVVAADRGLLLLDAPARGARFGQRGARGRGGLARVPVEERALLGRREQRLVRVLAVQVDERAPRSASSAAVASRPSM